MSWFKRGGERRSPESPDQSQADTDPNTCLEVFQNHWKQAWTVISCQDKRTTSATGQATADGVEAVLRNLEQMVTLLVSEDDDGGLPGPILRYVLESELLERFCAWCTINVSAHERLRMQQLRLFELIISQSKQLLLVHRPVIKPLLRLLIDVANSHEISGGELEFKVVLLLHQICICISQQNLILESFFSPDTDHGPARFLIFSLLIPYIHREGAVGQKARDALLLIMTLSARHPHIGRYIANNSDFCPVLATGLSGLYSSLPRRITPPTDDWHAITWDDCVRIPDLQMFLNSLQFSNAVVQVAHPLVRNQLIEFIYSGFLVPVLAPALHQDIPGLPVPLLDTDLFRISREEVMTATAYLDLFIRHVTEPHLLKAALRFVLVEKYDDVPILDTLLSRINSSSDLSTVTLALFHTLIDLNCEDVMLHLVFRYLVPCTHVMVSQRRSVRDLDLYGKSAEKFLSLRPSCCTRTLPPAPPPATLPAPPLHFVSSHSQRHSTSSSSSLITGPAVSVISSYSDMGTEELQGETSYFEYLHDARRRLGLTSKACLHWTFLYDGESPPPDSIARSDRAAASAEKASSSSRAKHRAAAPATGYIEQGSLKILEDSSDGNHEGSKASRETFDLKHGDFTTNEAVLLTKCNTSGPAGDYEAGFDLKLSASLDNVDTFVSYLNELDLSIDILAGQVDQSVAESLADFEELVSALSTGRQQRAGSTTFGQEEKWDKSHAPVGVQTQSHITTDTIPSVPGQSEIPFTGDSKMEPSTGGNAALEEVALSQAAEKSTTTMQRKQLHLGESSILDTSLLLDKVAGRGDVLPPQPDSDQDRAVGTAQAVHGSSPYSSQTVTTKKEHTVPKDLPSSSKSAVPKDLPASSKSSMNPLYSLSTSMLSPMKSPGEMSPFRSVLTPPEEFPATIVPSFEQRRLNYPSDPPNIGPFLSALFARLEGMVTNSLYFNLLLTDVLSRLAAYPQPLLRSFLLNHNLVFQPSVKSLIQVLSSLRQKVDNYSMTVRQFDSLVDSARNNLAQREDLIYQSQGLDLAAPGTQLPGATPPQQLLKLRADTIAVTPQSLKVAEKKKVTLSDLIFRRSPGKEKTLGGKNSKKRGQLEQVAGDSASHHHNTNSQAGSDSDKGSGSDSSAQAQHITWNAVYCALILDEFLKELAALSQEHSVLHADEGYLSS